MAQRNPSSLPFLPVILDYGGTALSAAIAPVLGSSIRQLPEIDPLVSETTASKSSQIHPGHDRYKEFTHSHSVRRLAHWIGLSSNATFHLCYALNFLLMLTFIYWKGCPRLTAALRARSSVAAQRARHELKAFAANLSVSIARQSIRIDERTDQDLIRAFVKPLEYNDEIGATVSNSDHQKE